MSYEIFDAVGEAADACKIFAGNPHGKFTDMHGCMH